MASHQDLIHANAGSLCCRLAQPMLAGTKGSSHWRLRSPPKGAAPCSGWSNGTKSVFLRGLVPFNQLQQGWQCAVLGETEEVHLKLKLLTNAFLKEMTLILSHTLMLPGGEKRGALGSKVSKIFVLNTESSVPLYPQRDPLLCS